MQATFDRKVEDVPINDDNEQGDVEREFDYSVLLLPVQQAEYLGDVQQVPPLHVPANCHTMSGRKRQSEEAGGNRPERSMSGYLQVEVIAGDREGDEEGEPAETEEEGGAEEGLEQELGEDEGVDPRGGVEGVDVIELQVGEGDELAQPTIEN